MVDEDLRLVLEAAERGAVDDAVAIALEGQAEGVLRLGVKTAARRQAAHRIGRQRVVLEGGELCSLQHARASYTSGAVFALRPQRVPRLRSAPGRPGLGVR